MPPHEQHGLLQGELLKEGVFCNFRESQAQQTGTGKRHVSKDIDMYFHLS